MFWKYWDNDLRHAYPYYDKSFEHKIILNFHNKSNRISAQQILRAFFFFYKILQHSNDRFNIVLNRCYCQSFFHSKGVLYWIGLVSIKTQGLFVAVCNNGGPNLPVRSAIQANCYLKPNYQERIWSSMFKWTTKFTWYGLPLTQTATKFCFGYMADPTVHSWIQAYDKHYFKGWFYVINRRFQKIHDLDQTPF